MPSVPASAEEWLAVASRGACNICGGVGTITMPADADQIEDSSSLREFLACSACGAISRDRALILALAGMLGERSA